MSRNGRCIQNFKRHSFARDFRQHLGDGGGETPFTELHAPQNFAGRVRHRHEGPTIVFRQALDQRDNLLFQQAGNEPPQTVGVDLIESLLGDDQGQSIVLGTRIEPVLDRQTGIPHCQRIRKRFVGHGGDIRLQ